MSSNSGQRSFNKYPIPPTFQEILRDFTMECLRDQPKNIYEYGAQYFAAIDEDVEFIYQAEGQSPSPGQSPRQEAASVPEHQAEASPADQTAPNESPYVSKEPPAESDGNQEGAAQEYTADLMERVSSAGNISRGENKTIEQKDVTEPIQEEAKADAEEDVLRKMCDQWFDQADTNKDGVLNFAEAKPLVENWILGEFGEDQGPQMVVAVF